MNFNLNDLMDDVLVRFYQTYSLTLDTVEYVPNDVNAMILRFITKNLKKAFKKIGVEDRKYQRELLRKAKRDMREKLEKEYMEHNGQERETLPMQVGSTEACDSGELCETRRNAETG